MTLLEWHLAIQTNLISAAHVKLHLTTNNVFLIIIEASYFLCIYLLKFDYLT